MDRFIFLDIDGVLNNEKLQYRVATILTPTLEEFASTLCPECLQRVRTLRESTGAHIVLTSTWRHWFSRREIQDVLGLPIYSMTERGSDRLDEIHTWMRRQFVPFQYVILDDLRLGDPPQHVKINPKTGFTEEDLKQAELLLRGTT